MTEEKAGFFSTERGKRFIKFATIGLIGWGLNELLIFLFLLMFDSIFDYNPLFVVWVIEFDKVLVSSIISISIVMTINFILNKLWTFKEQEKEYQPKAFLQFLQFTLIGIIGFALYTGIIIGLHTHLSVNKYLATSIAFFVGLVNNFVWNDLWTFNPKFMERRMKRKEKRDLRKKTRINQELNQINLE